MDARIECLFTAPRRESESVKIELKKIEEWFNGEFKSEGVIQSSDVDGALIFGCEVPSGLLRSGEIWKGVQIYKRDLQ